MDLPEEVLGSKAEPCYILTVLPRTFSYKEITGSNYQLATAKHYIWSYDVFGCTNRWWQLPTICSNCAPSLKTLVPMPTGR